MRQEDKITKIDDLLATVLTLTSFDGKFNLIKNYIFDENTEKENEEFFGMLFMLAEIYSSHSVHYDQRMKDILKVSDKRWLFLFAIAFNANDCFAGYRNLLKELNITLIDDLIEEIDEAIKSDFNSIPDSYIKFLIYAFNGKVNITVTPIQRLFLSDRKKLNLVKDDYTGFISVIFLDLK